MRTLGAISAVTHVVADLGPIIAAYGRVLGFTPVRVGRLGAEAARGWGAPRAEGAEFVILARPRVEAELRFIARPHAAGWRALTSWGWNCAEFLVADPDAMARACAEDGAFQVIGPPMSLTRFPMIRAMQALGPAGECLYFTRTGEGHGLDLAQAREPVDRVFIAVAGGPDLARMLGVYRGFGNAFDPPVATPVRVLSRANGLDPETPHAHALVALGAGTHVELDEYPPQCAARPVPEGDLPPGMAIVSFRGGPRASHRFATPCAAGDQAASLQRGAAGELIEVLEAA